VKIALEKCHGFCRKIVITPRTTISALAATICSLFCLEIYSFRDIITSLYIVHIVEMPSVTISPGRFIALREGEAISLTCKASGKPMPSVIWKKLNASVDGTYAAFHPRVVRF